MTARRHARGHLLPATDSGGVPAAFLVGRCLEVWADPVAKNPAASAVRRFALARSWWLGCGHVDKPTDRDALIPLCTPWSIGYLSDADQASAAVQSSVAERLVPAAANPADVPALAAQAEELFLASKSGGDRRPGTDMARQRQRV